MEVSLEARCVPTSVAIGPTGMLDAAVVFTITGGKVFVDVERISGSQLSVT